MNNQKKTDDIAAERFKLLSPLLASGQDAAKAAQLMQTGAFTTKYESAD